MCVEKKSFFKIFFFCLLFLTVGKEAFAQVTIKGRIIDPSDGSGIIGANVVIKGTTTGVSSDFDGDFDLKVDNLPVIILISSLGYESLEQKITDASKKVTYRLKPTQTELSEVEVVGSRLSEKQKESPLTVESLDVIAIKETASSNFYEGLGALKGVDVTAASLGFRIINTRGFNSTSPVRSLQIIDGVDNQAPGLNFSLGNFVGASELDLEAVEIIVGASSAQYGPNAFNGVVSMTTKDPFLYQGVSAMAKVGERNLRETAVRYAKAFKLGKVDYENIAFKLNFFYLQADDWEADNYDPTLQAVTDQSNPGGFDAVNIYGDESYVFYNQNRERRFTPGLEGFARTGYKESDLVDYNTNNLKAAAALHYKITRDVTLKYSYNYGTGTTVYQGDNRYSLRGIKFNQQKVELQGKRFFIRAYNTAEDAGESYDAVFTALLLNQAGKSNGTWNENYASYWETNINPRVFALPGFPPQNQIQLPPNGDINPLYFQVLNANQALLAAWHAEARAFADGPSGAFPGRYTPGTEAFQAEFDKITSRRSFLEGGSRFFDQSALSHIHGEYNFNQEFADIKLGGNYRQYRPNSAGTIFSDTNGRVITNSEFGVYSQAEKKFFAKRLKLTAAGRVDKNENFDFVASPAFSAVYVVKKNHNYRISFSSAIRNPTLQDQYLYYNVGRALLLGNLNGRQNVVNLDNYLEFATSQAFDTTLLRPFNIDPIRPEKVRSLEVGYKGTVLKKIFIDASAFYSWYTDFIGFRLVADQPTQDRPFVPIYRISSNARDEVHTKGASIGVTYFVGKFYALTGNYTYNELDRRGSTDPIIPAFNTPTNKFNIGFNGRDIVSNFWGLTLRNWGFNVNYKYVQGFLFEGSPQFTGFVPEYDMVDAQVNYTLKKIHTTFKLGSSNLLNNQRFQVYGGPRIGRMTYFSVLVDIK